MKNTFGSGGSTSTTRSNNECGARFALTPVMTSNLVSRYYLDETVNERIVERIRESVARSSITLVSGNRSSGKSTLVHSYCASLPFDKYLVWWVDVEKDDSRILAGLYQLATTHFEIWQPELINPVDSFIGALYDQITSLMDPVRGIVPKCSTLVLVMDGVYDYRSALKLLRALKVPMCIRVVITGEAISSPENNPLPACCSIVEIPSHFESGEYREIQYSLAPNNCTDMSMPKLNLFYSNGHIETEETENLFYEKILESLSPDSREAITRSSFLSSLNKVHNGILRIPWEALKELQLKSILFLVSSDRNLLVFNSYFTNLMKRFEKLERLDLLPPLIQSFKEFLKEEDQYLSTLPYLKLKYQLQILKLKEMSKADSLELAQSHLDIGSMYFEIYNFKKAIKYHTSSLEYYEYHFKKHNNSHRNSGGFMVEEEGSSFDDSNSTTSNASTGQENSFNNKYKNKETCYCSYLMGKDFVLLGDYSKARHFLEIAFDFFSAGESRVYDREAGEAAYWRARAEEDQKSTTAIEWYLKARQLLDTFQSDLWMCSSVKSINNSLLYQRDASSVNTIKNVIYSAVRVYPENHPVIGLMNQTLGNCLLENLESHSDGSATVSAATARDESTSKVESIIEIFKRAMSIRGRCAHFNRYDMVKLYIGLGRCCLLLSDGRYALENFSIALEMNNDSSWSFQKLSELDLANLSYYIAQAKEYLGETDDAEHDYLQVYQKYLVFENPKLVVYNVIDVLKSLIQFYTNTKVCLKSQLRYSLLLKAHYKDYKLKKQSIALKEKIGVLKKQAQLVYPNQTKENCLIQ